MKFWTKIRATVAAFIFAIIGVSCAVAVEQVHVERAVPITVIRTCGDADQAAGWIPIPLVSVSKYYDDNPPLLSEYTNIDVSKIKILGLPGNCSVVLSSSVGPMELIAPDLPLVLNDRSSPYYMEIFRISENIVAECKSARLEKYGSSKFFTESGELTSGKEAYLERTHCLRKINATILASDLNTSVGLFRMYILEDDLFLWKVNK